MSHIPGQDVVKYACTCGLLKPISQLYFCRYCFQLRCSFCVCHEVECHFCVKCSENLPTSEARVKKNLCNNCFVCPSCQQDLSVRIAAKGSTASPEDAKSAAKKMYYLACLFCRWSSRDVGIPDQTSVTGGWPERENVYANRLQEVLDLYKAMVLSEKQQKENQKKKQRGKYISYSERTGVSTAVLRKRIGLPADIHPLLKTEPKGPTPAVAKEEVEELPDEIFTQPINLMEITTIEQRLLHPEAQPVTVDKLFPLRKQLSVKRSLRCRACEHNVSKPEYSPNSIKFKIQLFAYYHVPDVRIVTVEPLRAGKPSELIIIFVNPTQHQTTISFLELNLEEQEQSQQEEQIAEVAENLDHSLTVQDAESQPTSLSSLLSLASRQRSMTIKPSKIKQEVNCDVVIPTSSFILPHRDDAAEYDDSGDTHNIQDDPKLVVWRKSNKAFVKLQVTPKADLPVNSEVVCGFVMQHLYTNTIATVENKLPQKYEHKVKVFLKLGTSVGSA